ncbi:hypothetical protein [Maritimibacter sp. DP1N21-5]|uniref:hypothetical protein n=1 Tax=Maritimibacter sp. DP1N21-5 TaxID=2836867 RepID=UPI001C467325|nr:hypothetical protein [Maritimibacter sp. DP1N21-5]MBV7410496.1 hypothetical protein [Maritimibacter sp. DP1N21-5]
MRMFAAPLSLLAIAGVLSACSSSMPNDAHQAQEPVMPAAAPVAAQPLSAMATDSTMTAGSSEGAAIAAEASQVLGFQTAPAATTAMPDATAMPMTTGPATVGTSVAAVETGTAASVSSISDEQNFAAVSERESIESDAQRLAENRAQYVVIQPTALPQREGGGGASIVHYALATNNPKGQQMYSRSIIAAQSRFERNCGKFTSQDRAQEAFLDAGGPERDPKGLDPDGDGFACFWDPAPFRAARNAVPAQPDYVATSTAQ